MFGDLLVALQAVIGALSSIDSGAFKRRKFARRLLNIHISLGIIVERGSQILSILTSDYSPTRQVAVGLFYEQDMAIRNLVDNLSDDDFIGPLQLHLPIVRHLRIVADAKSRRLGFYLSQLTMGGELEDERKKLQAELAELEDELNYRLLDFDGLRDVRRQRDSVRDQIKDLDRKSQDLWIEEFRRELDLNKLELEELRLLVEPENYVARDSLEVFQEKHERARHQYLAIEDDNIMTIYATPKQVELALEALGAIEEAASSIKTFLLEKCELEDLL